MFSDVGFFVQLKCLLANGPFRAEACRCVNMIYIITDFSYLRFIVDLIY